MGHIKIFNLMGRSYQPKILVEEYVHLSATTTLKGKHPQRRICNEFVHRLDDRIE